MTLRKIACTKYRYARHRYELIIEGGGSRPVVMLLPIAIVIRHSSPASAMLFLVLLHFMLKLVFVADDHQSVHSPVRKSRSGST